MAHGLLAEALAGVAGTVVEAVVRGDMDSLRCFTGVAGAAVEAVARGDMELFSLHCFLSSAASALAGRSCGLWSRLCASSLRRLEERGALGPRSGAFAALLVMDVAPPSKLLAPAACLLLLRLGDAALLGDLAAAFGVLDTLGDPAVRLLLLRPPEVLAATIGVLDLREGVDVIARIWAVALSGDGKSSSAPAAAFAGSQPNTEPLCVEGATHTATSCARSGLGSSRGLPELGSALLPASQGAPRAASVFFGELATFLLFRGVRSVPLTAV